MALPTCTPDVEDASRPVGGDFIYCLQAEIRAVKAELKRKSINFAETAPVAMAGKLTEDFDTIPSWAKCITVFFNDISLAGTDVPGIRVGSGGVPADTGYLTSAQFGTAQTNATKAFRLRYSSSTAAETFNGFVQLRRESSTTHVWCIGGQLKRDNGDHHTVAGKVTLSAALDVLQVISVDGSTDAAGTDTFDAGTVNVTWE